MRRGLIVVVLVTFLTGEPAAAEQETRHAGRIHSMDPAQAAVVLLELGAHGLEQLVEAQIGDAKLVRVWRDPARPWRWRERPIGLYELLSAPFVVLIGRQDRYGRIIAARVEVPVIPSE